MPRSSSYGEAFDDHPEDEHESSFGRLFEVTKDGQIVWEYVNPFFGRPFFVESPDTQGNLIFRALRYSAEEIARAKATVSA